MRHARGFTLIELLVGMVILGILTVVVFVSIGGGATSASRAETLHSTGASMARSWALLSMAAGANNAPVGSPIPAAGATVVDVLERGAVEVAPAFQAAYRDSGLVPMSGFTGGRGAQQLLGYPVSVAGSGTGSPIPFAVILQNVPDEIVLALVQRHGSRAAVLAVAGDTSDRTVQYGPSVAGTRTVTLIYNI